MAQQPQNTCHKRGAQIIQWERSYLTSPSTNLLELFVQQLLQVQIQLHRHGEFIKLLLS